MSPSEVRAMDSGSIVEMLAGPQPQPEALVWLSSLVADRAMAAGVQELQRRFAASKELELDSKAFRSSNSVRIDPDRFRRAMWRRRLPLNQVGPLINRSDALASVWCNKRRINFFTLDELATELGTDVDSLIREVCGPEEMERLGV